MVWPQRHHGGILSLKNADEHPLTEAFAQLSAALAGRYRLERELGEGGMATVYLASDVRHERQVAVKVLRPDLSASIGSERFLQEIRIAAKLSHPHILPLHDSGEANGLLYYVMPYVAGESLRQRITREGELPITDAARILRDVSDALGYAHEHGVVHRDIKPENILLTGRHALVADFGVAKALSEATGKNKLTTAGVALGTPAYMAPEQAVADPHVDHRADIYALGVVGYEMIVGSPPFTGGSPQQVLAAQVTELPRPVTARRPAVPPLLATAIMRCLEKKPADRWQSADDLLHHIEAAQTTTGGSTPTDTRPLAAASWRARRRWPLIAASAAVIAALAALGAWLAFSSSLAAGPAVTLLGRTQLTFTGRIQSPAISPDGKQLAFVTQECTERGCAYSVDVQDVGGTATRRVLAGAASANFLEWSPDRRNLLVTGTINGSWGTHLVSLLGGGPRRVGLGGGGGGGGVSFYAGGDSLLITPRTSVNTLQWIGVAPLGGVVRDSIPIRTAGSRITAIGAVPGTGWIDVTLESATKSERIILDRSGRETSRQTIPFGSMRASGDALWLAPQARNAQAVILRTPFDPSTGRASARADTVYAGRFTGFSVSADGTALVVDDGTYQHSVYALELADALTGQFAERRRLLQASTALHADLSPDGHRVLLGRVIPAASGIFEARWSLVPFDGGVESPLALLPGTTSSFWFDSTTVAGVRRDGATLKFFLFDVNTGTTSHEFASPDSLVWDWAPLPGGGWTWIRNGMTLQIHERGQTRSFPKPAWYEMLTGIGTSPRGRFLVRGWNASTSDTMGISEVSLRDGSITPLLSHFADDGRIYSLNDGSFLFLAYETAESATLIQLTGANTSRRLGTIPRPITRLSVSDDLKRAVVTTRAYFGDAWMMRVMEGPDK